MIRSLFPNSFYKLNKNLSNKGRFNLAVLFSVFSAFTSPNQVMQSYSQQSVIVVDSNTETSNSSHNFCKQMFSKDLEAARSSMSYKRIRKNAALNSVQSIELEAGAGRINLNDEIASLENITNIIISQTSKVNNFVEQIFKRSPATNHYFLINYIATKDCINNANVNFKFQKTAYLQKDFVVKCALNDLHCKLFVFYNSRAQDNCFSKVFSVRPPPVV